MFFVCFSNSFFHSNGFGKRKKVWCDHEVFNLVSLSTLMTLILFNSFEILKKKKKENGPLTKQADYEKFSCKKH